MPYCYVVTSRKPIAVFEELNESRAAVQRLLGTTAVVVASIGVNPPGVFYASGQAVGSLFCLMVAHDAIVARYTGLIKEGALRG